MDKNQEILPVASFNKILDSHSGVRRDSPKLEKVLEVLKEKMFTSGKRPRTDEAENKSANRIKIAKKQIQAEADRLKEQTQLLLLARYQELRPAARFIDWRDIVIEWPDDVILRAGMHKIVLN